MRHLDDLAGLDMLAARRGCDRRVDRPSRAGAGAHATPVEVRAAAAARSSGRPPEPVSLGAAEA